MKQEIIIFLWFIIPIICVVLLGLRIRYELDEVQRRVDGK